MSNCTSTETPHTDKIRNILSNRIDNFAYKCYILKALQATYLLFVGIA
jgi:hypothetical protein